MTKVAPAPYDADAKCPTWLAFLARIMNGNQPLIDFLQRAVGYSLTGTTGERCLLFLYGIGANGKSTFLEVLRALLAEYAQQADFTTFLERKGDSGPRNDIARLFGARVVTSSEVGEGKRLNESLVKTLTGNDTVTARFLHAEFFEFSPQFKLWLAANHRPVIRGTDNAIWTRVRLVPFLVSIPEGERDLGLKDKLVAELPGILAWAVQGCLLWHEYGLGMPAAVQEATESYRRESDTLGAFLEDCTVAEADAATKATELYQAYKQWAEEAGEYQLTRRPSVDRSRSAASASRSAAARTPREVSHRLFASSCRLLDRRAHRCRHRPRPRMTTSSRGCSDDAYEPR
jgi:putative DNA primase/helicase